jgi:WD40 repeat protein
MTSTRLLSLVLACMLTTACISNIPRHPAKVINENAHSGGSTLAFSNDSSIAASGGWSGNIRLWQMPDGSHIHKWQAHTGSVNGILFLQGDKRLVSGGYDGRIVEWSMDGSQIRSVTTPSPIRHLVANEQHDHILTGHEDGSVRQWRLSDFRQIHATTKHSGAIRAVAAHHASGWMASSADDGEVWIWNGTREPKRLSDPGSDARTLVFSPDGKQLYGGAWFHLYRWSIPDGRMQQLDTDHGGIINEIRFGPKGDYLASISRQTDSAVLFLNPEDGKTVKHFQKHELCGVAIAVSPNGRYISTTSDDASVRFYDLMQQSAGQ